MQTKTVAGRTWHFSHPIGWLSARGRGFWHPLSVAIAPEGVLYVLNSGDRQGEPITKLNFDEEFLGEFGSDDLTWPNSLALDADGNVYCSDAYGHFVAVYSPDGERMDKWGVEGTADGQIRRPAGLAFDSDDNLLLADSENGRVQKFTKDGRFLSAWGAPGSSDGQFDRPWGISIDEDGCIYVADWGNNRVQKFSPEGDFLMRIGSLNDDV